MKVGDDPLMEEFDPWSPFLAERDTRTDWWTDQKGDVTPIVIQKLSMERKVKVSSGLVPYPCYHNFTVLYNCNKSETLEKPDT